MNIGVSDARDVAVQGNHQLSRNAILQISGLAQNPGLEAVEVRRRLKTTSLFAKVSVEASDKEIVIFVEEKISWFVLPFFLIDVESKNYGLILGKSSLLGEHSEVIARYQMGTNNREATFLAKDEYIFGTPWFAGGTFDYEDSLHSVFVGRNIMRRMKNKYIGGSFQAGVHLSPWLSLGLHSYFEHHEYEKLDEKILKGNQLSHRIYCDFGSIYLDEGIAQGAMARTYVELSNPVVSDFHFQKSGILAQVSIYRHGQFNWITRPRFELGVSLPRYQLFELGGSRLRGFATQQFRGTSSLVVQNDLLLTVWNAWSLKFRPIFYTDLAYVESGVRTGVGAGFHVYFKEVAIPAVQVFAGDGFNPNGYSVSAALGPQL